MKYTTFQNLDGGRTIIARDGTKFWHWLTILLLVGVISTGGTYFHRKMTKMDRESKRLQLLQRAEESEPKTKATRTANSLASIRAMVAGANAKRDRGNVISDATSLMAARKARLQAKREAKQGS